MKREAAVGGEDWRKRAWRTEGQRVSSRDADVFALGSGGSRGQVSSAAPSAGGHWAADGGEERAIAGTGPLLSTRQLRFPIRNIAVPSSSSSFSPSSSVSHHPHRIAGVALSSVCSLTRPSSRWSTRSLPLPSSSCGLPVAPASRNFPALPSTCEPTRFTAPTPLTYRLPCLCCCHRASVIVCTPLRDCLPHLFCNPSPSLYTYVDNASPSSLSAAQRISTPAASDSPPVR